MPPGSKYPVRLNVNHDLDAFDEQMMHELKMKPVEREFYRLKEVIAAIVSETVDFLKNEESMRATNGIPPLKSSCHTIYLRQFIFLCLWIEKTFEYVSRFSWASILVLIVLGGYMIYYFKNFFRAKKLI